MKENKESQGFTKRDIYVQKREKYCPTTRIFWQKKQKVEKKKIFRHAEYESARRD